MRISQFIPLLILIPISLPISLENLASDLSTALSVPPTRNEDSLFLEPISLDLLWCHTCASGYVSYCSTRANVCLSAFSQAKCRGKPPTVPVGLLIMSIQRVLAVYFLVLRQWHR